MLRVSDVQVTTNLKAAVAVCGEERFINEWYLPGVLGAWACCNLLDANIDSS